MMLSSRLIEVRPGNARLARIRLTTVALALLAFAAVARAGRTPTVPANLQVPATQVVAFHAYAAGVQIYVCDPTKPGWIFKAPEATLYDADGNVVGMHYAGPTWESASGGKVVGKVLQRSPSPDPNAIPWLLLKAVSSEGPGVFARVTYIQRINTSAGKAPIDGCDEVNAGVELRMPYTAEYYFYRAQP